MQAATVSLLRIFTDGGRTLCSVPEGGQCPDNGSHNCTSMRKANSSVAPGAVAAEPRPGQQRRSLDSCRTGQAGAAQPRMSLEIAGRAYSLGLF